MLACQPLASRVCRCSKQRCAPLLGGHSKLGMLGMSQLLRSETGAPVGRASPWCAASPPCPIQQGLTIKGDKARYTPLFFRCAPCCAFLGPAYRAVCEVAEQGKTCTLWAPACQSIAAIGNCCCRPPPMPLAARRTWTQRWRRHTAAGMQPRSRRHATRRRAHAARWRRHRRRWAPALLFGGVHDDGMCHNVLGGVDMMRCWPFDKQQQA